MNISKSLSQILNSIQLSYQEHIVLQNLLYPITPIVQLFCPFSSLTIAYPSLGFNSYSLIFVVPISASCIPPLYHTVLFKLHFRRFLQSSLFWKCVLCILCVLYYYHSFPYTQLIFYPI